MNYSCSVIPEVTGIAFAAYVAAGSHDLPTVVLLVYQGVGRALSQFCQKVVGGRYLGLVSSDL